MWTAKASQLQWPAHLGIVGDYGVFTWEQSMIQEERGLLSGGVAGFTTYGRSQLSKLPRA